MTSIHWQQPWLTVGAVNQLSATPDEDAKGHIADERLWQWSAVLGLAAEKPGYEDVPAFADAQRKLREAFELRHLASGWTKEELATELRRATEYFRDRVEVPDFDPVKFAKPDRRSQAITAIVGTLGLALLVGAGWLVITVLGWVGGLLGFNASDDFLDTVRAESSSFDDIPDSTLLDTGSLICDADDAGMEDWAIRATFINNGLEPSEMSAIAYAAREHLC